MDKFSKICKDIKSIKIQGATNVALAGLKAYSLKPLISSRKIILSLRPTEPALKNALDFADKSSIKNAVNHFQNSQEFINYFISKIVKNNSVIMTHCHSNTLVKGLIQAYKSGKHFSVINLETRPLFQGRKTAKQLSSAGIKVSMTIDSAMASDIQKSSFILIGADAITNKGVFNKIGSKALAELAKLHKKELYVVSDSWKYSKKSILVEERSPLEIWKSHPKKLGIENFAFEFINKKLIYRIISEFGIQKYEDFVKDAKKSLR
jgi:ribose 1,5-bisphosphate isomerase